MRPRTNRHRALALAITVVILSAAFASVDAIRTAGARSAITASGTTVDVTAMTGYAFGPNAIQQVPTNSTITVVFTDATPLSHTLTIIGREGWVIPNSYSADQLNELAWGKQFPSLFNVNVSGSGDQETGTFQSTGPGWYEFFCAEGGHFAEGMYGFIAFGMNLPSNLTVSSGVPQPGAALFIIIGSIASLVVIALVLGFIVGRRKGAEHEMPPERLGYPEPVAGNRPLPPSSGDDRHP